MANDAQARELVEALMDAGLAAYRGGGTFQQFGEDAIRSVAAALARARADEREAIAASFDWSASQYDLVGEWAAAREHRDVAAAIRARGQK